MSDVEKSSWKAVKMTVEGLFGNQRRDDYILVILNLTSAY